MKKTPTGHTVKKFMAATLSYFLWGGGEHTFVCVLEFSWCCHHSWKIILQSVLSIKQQGIYTVFTQLPRKVLARNVTNLWKFSPSKGFQLFCCYIPMWCVYTYVHTFSLCLYYRLTLSYWTLWGDLTSVPPSSWTFSNQSGSTSSTSREHPLHHHYIIGIISSLHHHHYIIGITSSLHHHHYIIGITSLALITSSA